MYERSAIVLERYFDNLFGFNKQYNLKENYAKFIEFLEEIAKYEEATKNEEEIISEFDQVANEIQMIQKTQEKLSESSIQLENERIKLFNDLDEDPSLIEKKLEKIEEKISSNNEELEEVRVNFIKYLKGFSERQKERNRYTKARRVAESTHINFVKEISEYVQKIDLKDIKRLNEFENSDNIEDVENLTKIMSDNGKNERVKFDEQVLNKAISERIKIGREEAKCYILIYDRTRKLLKELDNDSFKFSKYQKILRDVNAKLSFINAEKDYIVGFLDNERMTTMNGPKVHKDMMEEACKNFDLDIVQIQNLYELLLKEITNKATKKIYKELYDNGYLKEIEAKEKSFEKQVSNINVTGTFINSNYWRLEGMKNIYEIFENQVTQKFDRDLSEFKEQEEIESFEEEVEFDDNQDIFVSKNEDSFNNEEEQDDEEYYSEDDYDEEESDEYDIEDDEYDIDDEDDQEDEYDDYEDEYDDEEDDEYYYDDDDEDEYDDEDDDDYDDNEDDEEYDYYEDYDEEDDEDLEEDFDKEKIMNKKYNEDNKSRTTQRNRQNVKKTSSKKNAEKNDKPGIFRNFLGKMKNENKS